MQCAGQIGMKTDTLHCFLPYTGVINTTYPRTRNDLLYFKWDVTSSSTYSLTPSPCTARPLYSQ